MRILGITGSHRRHLYFFDTLRASLPISGVIIQGREEMIPSPPSGIDERDRLNFIEHFRRRSECESTFFREPSLEDVRVLRTEPEHLNSSKTIEFVQEIAPDVVVIFGCDLIRSPLMDVLPEHTLNVHLGLSPRYRGAATLFWPFYFLEPNHAGSTLHYIVAEPDAGAIVHQVVPNLEATDGIHEVACRTVVETVGQTGAVLSLLQQKGSLERRRQVGTGKNFLERDFRPEHLRMVYDQCHNQTVKMFLDGVIQPREPKLYRQF